LPVFRDEKKAHVARKLGENLTAHPARERGALPARDENARDRVAFTRRDHRRHCRPFGT
jgi:hypothetical protein